MIGYKFYWATGRDLDFMEMIWKYGTVKTYPEILRIQRWHNNGIGWHISPRFSKSVFNSSAVVRYHSSTYRSSIYWHGKSKLSPQTGWSLRKLMYCHIQHNPRISILSSMYETCSKIELLLMCATFKKRFQKLPQAYIEN